MIYTSAVDWPSFYSRLDRALRGMAEERFDMIVAIAQGGILPAAFLQQETGLPLRVVRINFRDPSNKPRQDGAVLQETEPFGPSGLRILLVDDVSRTGKTLARALDYLSGNAVKTFLVNGRADYSLFDTEECIRMPWKRGETLPAYAV